MYASDLTNRKRAQVLHSDISRQKELLNSGAISRVNYQKGGTDYAYMINLEEGCINNTCTGVNYNLISLKNGNALTIMDVSNATYIDPLPLIEYGYGIYVDASGNSISLNTNTSPYTWTIVNPANTVLSIGVLTTLPAYAYYTADDISIPIPMGSATFNFFNQTYNSSNPTIYWSTNGAITFSDPLTKVVSIGAFDSSGNTPIAASYFPAILLGNYDRRLNKLYVRQDNSNIAYSIINLYVFFENSISTTLSTPNTGKYQIRMIKELYGQMRQWIEVRVFIAPANSGYISNQRTTDTAPSGNYAYADPTKLSPYNITDGVKFYNPCGTTFSTASPEAGTSFVLQSDSTGTNWMFINNVSVPV